MTPESPSEQLFAELHHSIYGSSSLPGAVGAIATMNGEALVLRHEQSQEDPNAANQDPPRNLSSISEPLQSSQLTSRAASVNQRPDGPDEPSTSPTCQKRATTKSRRRLHQAQTKRQRRVSRAYKPNPSDDKSDTSTSSFDEESQPFKATKSRPDPPPIPTTVERALRSHKQAVTGSSRKDQKSRPQLHCHVCWRNVQRLSKPAKRSHASKCGANAADFAAVTPAEGARLRSGAEAVESVQDTPEWKGAAETEDRHNARAEEQSKPGKFTPRGRPKNKAAEEAPRAPNATPSSSDPEEKVQASRQKRKITAVEEGSKLGKEVPTPKRVRSAKRQSVNRALSN
ncbi:MAG: hypothetical protein M1817_000185 [Caeruleum heppii]|nr:MAG: hypothetical protein M1817_000185 [Caeruleum heppii]